MVKISCIKDLEDVSDVCAKYIAKNELERLLTSYEIDNITCFGSIFLISDSSEFEDYSALGLTEPINQNFEFVDKFKMGCYNINRVNIYEIQSYKN